MNQLEFDVIDRLQAIRNYIEKEGEENFYISFSGGKDSTALSFLIDLAIPNNRIPRVYVDTGISYKLINQFVQELADNEEPYNFKRTGCKGCPFNTELQKDLDTLERFFPAEKKQCEIIWKPIYDEYRRISYRLKGTNDVETQD